MTSELFLLDLGTATLRKALDQLPLEESRDAVAILYSPQKCCFARFVDTVLVDADGNHLGGDVFEARVFNPILELRWLQTGFGANGARVGTAVVLHETSRLGGKRRADIVDTIPQRYLLWGKGNGRQAPDTPRWSRLSTARIGPLDVPVSAVPQRGRVVLKTREYVAQEPNHGNCFVAEERLLRLDLSRKETRDA